MGHLVKDPVPDGEAANDPGWRPVLRYLPWIVIPQLAIARFRRGTGDGLIATRVVYVSILFVLAVIGVVLPFVVPRARDGYGLIVGLLALSTLSCYGFEPRVERTLVTESVAALAISYRRRMFLRIAFAIAIALFGFVLANISGQLWAYYVGLLLALPALARAAPGVRALQREQDALTAQGCGLSLVAALRSTPVASKRRPYTSGSEG